MDIAGSYEIAAPRQTVWEGLNDPEILRQCIPGCEELEKLSDTEFEARVTAKVGPVRARFNGHVTLSDLNPPESYTISGEGKGGAAGFARGSAKVVLRENGDGTTLDYSAQANVGGKLAQVGNRLIHSTADKMAADFFQTFSDIVAGEAPAAEAVAEAAPERPEAAGGKAGRKTLWWVLAAVAAAIVIAVLLSGG
jgi:carbon monoxide dehydrogenase subunit G